LITKETGVTKTPQGSRHGAPLMSVALFSGGSSRIDQLTPSFFCRLDDDVVYWNTSRLSG
jgi:hypothetical protein